MMPPHPQEAGQIASASDGRIPYLTDVVLENIFRHVRHGQSPRALVNCMLRSKRLHDLGERILLRHVAITDRNIKSFVENAESRPERFEAVFHLTIGVRVPFSTLADDLTNGNDNDPPRPASNADRHMCTRRSQYNRSAWANPALHALEDGLIEIATTIRSHMRKLLTLSLSIKLSRRRAIGARDMGLYSGS